MFGINFIVFLFLMLVNSKKIPKDFDCSKAQWGPWRCEGDEDICTGKAFKYRCVGGGCTERSPCANLPDNVIEGICENVKSSCVAWWGEWSSWSKCSATCGYMEQKRFRACVGVALKNSIPGTCRDPNYVHTLPVGEANTQSNACFLRRLCPRIHGGWSSWGKFSSCSVTCGIGQISRKRMCTNPEPIGGGMICTGIDTDIVECNSQQLCPVHGQWCEWDAVDQCSKVCGGGSGHRNRRCECPRPENGGIDCFGDYQRYDACNNNICPYKPELTTSESLILFEDLASYIQADQWQYSNAGQVPQIGDVVTLQCPRTIKSRKKIFDVPDRFPLKLSFWHFNDHQLNDSEFYFTDDEFLIIRGLNRTMIGFYSFQYIRDPGQDPDIVCFFSVYLSDDFYEIRKGEVLHLHCLAERFDQFTKILFLGKWESWWKFDPDDLGIEAGAKSENFIWKSTSQDVEFRLSDYRLIEDVDDKVSGFFTCIVLNSPQNRSQRIFITQRLKIEITPELTFVEQIEIFLRKNVRTILILVGVTLILMLLLVIRFRQEAHWKVTSGGLKPIKRYNTITQM